MNNSLELKRESFICILSTRRSGKSYLIANLIYNFMNNTDDNDRTDLLYLFSNTAKFEQNGNYDFIDRRVIFKANPENVEKIVNRILEIQIQTNKKNHVLLVFDDIDLSKKYENSIERLATQGRHYNITTILSAQVATCAISPSIRNNISYLFFRKLNSETIKKQIYSMVITNSFESPEEFKHFVNENISDYQFMFYNNDADDKDLQIIKANPSPKDYRYVIKAPVNTEKEKPKRQIGWCAPLNITHFDSEGNPRKF